MRNSRDFWVRQAELALTKLNEIDRFGSDTFKEGDVIRFTYVFPNGSTQYKYAAIKVKGLWYSTGPRAPKAYTWDDLVSWWTEAQNDVGETLEVVRRNKGWKKVL